MVSPRTPSEPPRSLKRELLVDLGLVLVAALSLAVVTALIAQTLNPRFAALALVLLIVADVAVVFAFGRHVLDRLVLRPLTALADAAEALATGNLERRAPPSETAELTALAQRFNEMTEQLLDVRGQLVRTEKLASIGRLAAGVAHEIGNPLAAIKTYLDVAARRGSDEETLEALRREAARIDRIVRSLLEYARPGDEAVGQVDLNGVLTSAHELLRHQGAFTGVSVTLERGEHLPLVRGRAHALEQVIVNLALNAVDAVHERADRRIALGAVPWRYRVPERRPRRTDPQHMRELLEQRHSTVTRPPWRAELGPGVLGALLYVADSGPGIPDEESDRVFDPFYTTKPPGLGTGLGLAIVQRTVHEFGGVVWVDQAREGGAALKVFLPAIPAA